MLRSELTRINAEKQWNCDEAFSTIFRYRVFTLENMNQNLSKNVI